MARGDRAAEPCCARLRVHPAQFGAAGGTRAVCISPLLPGRLFPALRSISELPVQAGSGQDTLQGSTCGPGVALPLSRLHSSLSVQFVTRNSCTERLVEQEAPLLRVPAGSWGTQRAAPRHGYCQGRAQVSPCQAQGTQLLFAGRTWPLLVPWLLPALPSPVAPWVAAEQGLVLLCPRPQHRFSPQPVPRTAPLAQSCCA